jgi:hypothetical protein
MASRAPVTETNPPVSAWRLRARTIEAMIGLIKARLLVRFGRFARWRVRLGLAGTASAFEAARAAGLARHVERGAARLPFAAACLPRAMALSTMLQRRGIAHRLTIAARPASARGGDDDLHAWIECGGGILIGDLPGPWSVVYSAPPAET